MKYRKSIGLLLLLSCPQANPIEGLWSFDDTYSGTAVLPFLKLQPNGRSLAMGGSLSSIDRGAQSYFTNPALLASEKDFSLSVNHAEVLGEWQHESAVLNMPIPLWGSLAFALNTLRSGSIGDSRDEAEDIYSFSATDFLFGVSWSQSLWPERLDGGITLEYLQSRIDDITGKGYSVNIGLRGYLLYHLQSALTLKNISHGFRYRENGPLEPLPTLFQFSIGLPLTPHLPFAAQLAYEKSNEGAQVLSLGYEHAVLPWLFARTGYRWPLVANDQGFLNGLSAGLGVVLGPFAIDYGAQYRDALGWHQVFSLQFGSFPAHYLVKKEPLVEAQELWEQGDCGEASRIAQKVLDRDPQSLKAMWIIDHCRQERQMAEGEIINLLFSANTNGQLSPLRKEGKLLGGLARRATLIENLRQQHPQLVLLDAGNLAQTHDSKYIPLILSAYDLMDYQWVNRTWCDSTCPLQEDIYQSGSIKLRLLSAHTSPLSETQVNEFWLQNYTPPRDSLPNILLLNGNLDQARQIARISPDLRLIVLSGKQDLIEPLIEGSTTILCPGNFGTHLSWVQIAKDSRDPYLWFKNLTVHSGLSPDPKIKDILSQQTFYLEDTLRWVPVPPEIKSGFLYKAGNDSLQDLYYFDLNKKFSHRLTSQPLFLQSAHYSWTRQKVAFSALDSTKKAQLYLLDFKSRELKSLLLAGEEVLIYNWDPLENQLWFWVQTQPGLYDLRTVRPSGTDPKVLISQTSAYPLQMSFSGNGRLVAFLTESQGVRQIRYSSIEPFNPKWFERTKGKIKGIAFESRPSPTDSTLYILLESPTGFGPDEVKACRSECVTLFDDQRIQRIESTPMGPLFTDAQALNEKFIFSDSLQSQSYLTPREDLSLFSDSPPQWVWYEGAPAWVYIRTQTESKESQALISRWPQLATEILKIPLNAQILWDN